MKTKCNVWALYPSIILGYTVLCSFFTTNEYLLPTDTEIRNIPVEQRWKLMMKEIDRLYNHFTMRLKNSYPKMNDDQLHL